MEHTTLEQVVRQHITLPARANSQGWYSVLCKVCNDHGRKGKRAGFRFDDGTVGYNCFNCGHTALFNPQDHQTLSRDMVTVLEAFGIKKDDWQPALFSAAANKNSFSAKTVKKENYEPATVEMPPYITPLVENGDEFDQFAIEYLRKERDIDWKLYPFYIGRKSTHPGSQRWYGRLVIPFYKDGSLIFYQGRDLTGLRTKKYLSPDIPRENVIYGYEHLFRDTQEPIYIVEGWFDAWHLESVAVLIEEMLLVSAFIVPFP